jgi:hypothetical protein
MTPMPREFGKRTVVRPSPQVAAQPTPTAAPRDQGTNDPTLMRRGVLAIVLTVTIVGGMFFVLPKLNQCDGRTGVLGLDWCRLMKATVEGAFRGMAIGRGTAPGGR